MLAAASSRIIGLDELDLVITDDRLPAAEAAAVHTRWGVTVTRAAGA